MSIIKHTIWKVQKGEAMPATSGPQCIAEPQAQGFAPSATS